MKISSGGHDVHASGTVISYKKESLVFQLADDLRIIFKFLDDEVGKPHMNASGTDAHSLEITLFNFNNPLGTGIIDPLLIGELNDRELYVCFMVHSIAETPSKTFHYTWYLGVPYVERENKDK